MRRNVKNDKVLRAITIGLATMIAATSMPVTISADSQPLPISVEETDAIDNVVDEIEKKDDPETKDTDESGATDLITKANNEANNSTPSGAPSANDTLKEKIGQAALAIDDNQDNDSDVKEDLGDAKTAMQGALQADQESRDIIQYRLVFEVDENGDLKLDENGEPIPVYEIETDAEGKPQKDEDGKIVYKLDGNGQKIQKKVEIPIVVDVPVYELDENGKQKLDGEGKPIPVYEVETDENGNPKKDAEDNPIYKVNEKGEKIQKTVPMLKLYSELKKDTEDAADNAINNASVAMDNNSTKEQAEKAKADAEDDLKDAEDDLKDAEAELQNAEDKVEDAKTTLAAAKKKQADANAKVREATEALERALIQKKDENGNLVYDENNKPVYEGDVETAEQNLKDAVAEAERLESEAQTAYNNYNNENLNLIVEQYNVLTEIVKNDSDWKNNEKYEPAANKLCNLILQYYVFANEKDVRVGLDNFEVELIDSWTAGEPYPVYNVEGDETSGIKELRVDYDYKSGMKTFTEVIGKGYIHDPDNGYKYDENGNLISNPNEQNVAEGWIHSGTAANRNLDNRVVVTYYAKKLDENGNPVLDDEGNEVYEKKTKYFNYGTYNEGENAGQIYIYERTFTIENGKEVVSAQDYVAPVITKEKGPDTPESWKTSAGTEWVEPGETNQTVHKVYINNPNNDPEIENDKTRGFWAIDTSNTNSLVQSLNPESAPQNHDNVTYSTPSMNTTYSHETYKVTTGYEKKTGPQNEEHTWASDALSSASKLVQEGYNVQIVCHQWGKEDVTKDYNSITGWDKFAAFWQTVLSLGTFDSFTISTTNEIDDKTKPIQEDREGVWETTTATYTETTVDNKHIQKKYGDRLQSGSGYNEALDAYTKEKQDLIDAGYTIDMNRTHITEHKFTGWESWKDDYTDYEIYASKSTDATVVKTLSKKLYAADTYDQYTAFAAGSPAEYSKPTPAHGAKYAQKVVWQTDDDAGLYTAARAFTDDTFGNYITHLNDLQTQWSNYTTAKNAAQAALTKVTALKEQIRQLKNVELTCGAAVSALEAELNKAEMALEIAQGNVETLEAKVAAAQEAVNGIDLSRFNPSTPAQGGFNHRIFDPSDDDGDDSSSSTTTPGTGSGSFVTYTTPDNEFTLIPVGYAGAGAGAGAQAGGRTVASNRAADRSGVLGVRAEEETDTKKSTVKVINNIDNSEDKNKDKKNNAGEQKLVKVENSLVPLADTPFEEGAGMNWAWLLAAAAAAGAGAYGYGKHKKAVAANEEMKKYKK